MVNREEHINLFSERLLLLIKYNGLTSAGLARAINVSAPLITKYTTGKASPSFENFIKIADFFDVSMDYLRGKSNSFNGDLLVTNTVDDWLQLLGSLNLDDFEEKEIIDCLKLLYSKL